MSLRDTLEIARNNQLQQIEDRKQQLENLSNQPANAWDRYPEVLALEIERRERTLEDINRQIAELDQSGTETQQEQSPSKPVEPTAASEPPISSQPDPAAVVDEKKATILTDNNRTVNSIQTSTEFENSENTISDDEISLPLENPLKAFASFSPVITLAVLTPNEIANPANTYRKNGFSRIIFRSGGSADQQVPTEYEQNLGITAEYFVDDLEIQSTMALLADTKQTNANLISFTLKEPYSMGVFLQTLAASVVEADPSRKSYIDAAYVIMIEFIGFLDDGSVAVIPNTKRYFPFKLTNVNFDVTASGSEYSIRGIAWNEQAFADEVQTIRQDLELSGTTVADFLQLTRSNSESLTSVINERQRKRVESEKINDVDSYVIIFPESADSLNRFLNEETESDVGATTQSEIQDDQTVIQPVTVSLDKVREFADDPANLNAIGRSRVITEDYANTAHKKMRRAEEVIEENIIETENLTIEIGTGVFNFVSGARIQDVIEELVLLSEYAQDLVNQDADDLGMKKWFRIEADVYEKPDQGRSLQTGAIPKIYVFKVLEYNVHQSILKMPTEKPLGIDELRELVAKEYNYIYTGQNDDILDFSIQFNTAFYRALAEDLGEFVSQNQLGGQQQSIEQDEQAIRSVNSAPPEIEGSQDLARLYEFSFYSTGRRFGNSLGESATTTIARVYNDIIINGVDLYTVDLEIMGDPYYIADSGIGNYSAESSSASPFVTRDRTLDYQYGEPYILLNFRTPIDLGENGQMRFPTIGGTEPVESFSGLYKVVYVTNRISGNQFTQSLRLVRMLNQQNEIETIKELALEGGKPLTPWAINFSGTNFNIENINEDTQFSINNRTA